MMTVRRILAQIKLRAQTSGATVRDESKLKGPTLTISYRNGKIIVK